MNNSAPASRSLDGQRRRSVGRPEFALFAAALLAIAGLRLVANGGPSLSNDSYQYLSLVENLRDRHAIETSIVHFDEERARERVPAPATTFPVGYSLLVWIVSWSGLSLEWAGLLVSLASALLVLSLLRAAADSVNLGPVATRVALTHWAFSAQASLYGVSLLAETAFTAAYFGAVTLLLVDQDSGNARSWRVPAALLLVGAACWMRYAGLFLAAAFHLHALVLWVRRRLTLTWLASLAACDLLVGVLLVRNFLVAGTWSGGNSRAVRHDVLEVLRRLGVSAYELWLGAIRDPRTLPFGPFALLFCAGAVGILALAAKAFLRSGLPPPLLKTSHSPLLIVCACCYCAGMAYAGLTTQISLSARMFVPVLPVAALLAGLVVSAALKETSLASIGRSLVGLWAVGFLGANLQAAFSPRPAARHETVAKALALPTADGRPLSRWLDAVVPHDAVVLAVEGQATGYLLKRRTISAVGREFTALQWNAEETRRTMARFGAQYAIVYPDVVATGGVDGLDSELFRDLAAKRPPPWLALVAENASALVYQVRPGSLSGGGL